jgi:hypothetical protein
MTTRNSFGNLLGRELKRPGNEESEKRKKLAVFKPKVQNHLSSLCMQDTDDDIYNLCKDIMKHISDTEMPAEFVMTRLLDLLISDKHTQQSLVFSTMMSILDLHSPLFAPSGSKEPICLYAVLKPEVFLEQLAMRNRYVIRYFAALFQFDADEIRSDSRYPVEYSVYAKYTRQLHINAILNHYETLIDWLMTMLIQCHNTQRALFFEVAKLLLNITHWTCHPDIASWEDPIRKFYVTLSAKGNEAHQMLILKLFPPTSVLLDIVAFLVTAEYVEIKPTNDHTYWPSISSILNYKPLEGIETQESEWIFLLELMILIKPYYMANEKVSGQTQKLLNAYDPKAAIKIQSDDKPISELLTKLKGNSNK